MKRRDGIKIITQIDYTGKATKMAMKKVIGMEDLIILGLDMDITTDLITPELDGGFVSDEWVGIAIGTDIILITHGVDTGILIIGTITIIIMDGADGIIITQR